ncbi:DUF2971 domain-containing protein [Hydrogenophaga sp. ZJX-1]|uniref:DUF2971 domain-containing protein n=1 Tax=Hydrogenophaga sp. ZJX-1 TaxID=3404778 RepID=UPI003B28211D
METLLRRYTELPFVIDYLHTEELALLNPASWDDRNDSFYMEEYARRSGSKSVYALCLANCAETYHHWRVFSHGSGGACIQFNPEKFSRAISQVDGIRSEAVQYKTIEELKRTNPTLNELPFLKRYAFQNEGERRLFCASKEVGPPIRRIPMPRSTVDRIVLSPWLHDSVADRVKKTLKAIPGCSQVKIYRSTLVENEHWKKFANGSTY